MFIRAGGAAVGSDVPDYPPRSEPVAPEHEAARTLGGLQGMENKHEHRSA